jgi:hypothetical protein
VFGLLLFLDGLLGLFWGPGFLRWLLRKTPRQADRVIGSFLIWPDPILRVASLFQALAGWLIMTAPSGRPKHSEEPAEV